MTNLTESLNPKVEYLDKHTPDIKVEKWDIDKLIPYARNPRKNDHVVDKMVSQIKEFGLPIPLLIRPDGLIIDGHLRYKALKKLDYKYIPVVVDHEWTDIKVKAFRISINKSAEWAEWDTGYLALELEELENFDYDLTLTGFDTKELNDIMGDVTFTADSIEDGKVVDGEFIQESSNHVKMIQLFYDEETEKIFREHTKQLCEKLDIKNISDCVLQALVHYHNEVNK